MESRESTERAATGVPQHWRTERAAWDRLAAEMPDLFPAASTQYYRRAEMALIRRHLEPLAGRRLLKLDLWNEAFNTRILPWMSGRGAVAFGLDTSLAVGVRARRNALAASDPLVILQADMRRIPFAEGSFDIVYSMGTIEHVAEYRETIREIRRVLKPGGRAILGVPHKWDLFLRPLLVWALTLAGKYPYAPERCFGAGELSRVVEGCGLAVRARTGLLILPGLLRMADLYLHREKSRLSCLTALAIRPFEWLELRAPWSGRFGYLLVLVVERPAETGQPPG
jgi:SAM-dependent methyltransferase